MDEQYFLKQRDKYQAALHESNTYREQASSLAVSVANQVLPLIIAEAIAINQALGRFSIHFGSATNAVDNDNYVGSVTILATGGIHSGKKYDSLTIVSNPGTLMIDVKSGSTTVETLNPTQVSGEVVSKLLIDHAFRCLRKVDNLPLIK